MVRIDIAYEGDLHCRATHGPSGAQIVTDAPADNQGKGESFSPTDLLANSLGVCMLTTMAIYARRREIDLRGTRVTVLKEMVSEPHRRVGTVTVTLRMPAGIAAAQRTELETAARTCPVARSLHADVRQVVAFEWPEGGTT